MRDVILPEDHRTIRSIPVPVNRRRMGDTHERPPHMRTPEEDDFLRDEPRKRGSWFVWAAAVVVLAILTAVIGSVLFKKATVTVTPKSQMVAVPASLMAYADAPVGELGFQTVTTTNVANRTVPASGESHVEKRATGTLTIYNEYSTASQRLIKNTRFEAPDGKIYRIDESIVVLGGTKKADGTMTAGTLDVTVSADSAGDSYNKGLVNYTIPGFKGDPRFTKIYAKGKTDVSGGFIGTRKTVADADLNAAKTSIQSELTETLNTALIAAVPAGYLLVPKSAAIAYEELPQGGDANAATISLRGTAQGAIVREADLASAIAKIAGISGYTGEAVRLADVKKLNIEAKSTATPGVKTIPLALSGDILLIWQVDGEAIRSALKGASVSNLLTLLSKFKPAVTDAKATLRPFWKTSFPDEADLIEVTVKDPS